MLGSVILLLFGFFLIFFFFRVRRLKNLPPGPQPIPLFGNLLLLDSNNLLKDLDRLAAQYGSVFSLYIGHNLAVVLSGVQVIKDALVKHAIEFAGRPTDTMISHITEHRGIAFIDYGSRWRSHRRFALTTLKNLGMGKNTMQQRILEEVSHLSACLEENAGKRMDPQNLFHSATANIICSIIFGSRFNYTDKFFLLLLNMTQEFIKTIIGPRAMLYDIMPLLRRLPLPIRKSFQQYQQIRDFFQKVITQHKVSKVAGKPRDFIDSYLDKMDKVTHLCQSPEDDLFDETQMVIMLIDIFLAGTDTTSNTLRVAMLHLMNNPYIQERCHDEIEEVLVGRPHVSFEDRHNMPYVQAVIHESQRMADTVPLALFHSTTQNIEFHGYHIPKGTIVIANLSSVLHEEGQWKFPREFNPSNFLNDEGQFIKPEAFIPFSAGSRVCLGENLARMELFLILVTLLRRFRFVWPDDAGSPDYSLIFGITNSAKPYPMEVQLRLDQ